MKESIFWLVEGLMIISGIIVGIFLGDWIWINLVFPFLEKLIIK
jgi:hypothetical protein